MLASSNRELSLAAYEALVSCEQRQPNCLRFPHPAGASTRGLRHEGQFSSHWITPTPPDLPQVLPSAHREPTQTPSPDSSRPGWSSRGLVHHCAALR